MNNLKENLLIKELDLIDATISRLDTQMQKSKHFCILIWLGVLGFLFSEHFPDEGNLEGAIILTAFIPLLFWVMDYFWRKALIEVSWRQKMLSFFVNNTDLKNEVKIDFPLLDPTGKTYKLEEYPKYISENYNEKVPIYIKAWYYKEAIWFFPSMIVFSLFLSKICC